MTVAAISALVGALVSFVTEAIPPVKDWLAKQNDLVVRLIFAAVFYLVPLAFAFAACEGYVLPQVEATCPADRDAVVVLLTNSTVAFLSSQLWHGYANKKLKSAG